MTKRYYTLQQIYNGLRKCPLEVSAKISLTRRTIELCADSYDLLRYIDKMRLDDATLLRCRQTNTIQVVPYSNLRLLIRRLNEILNISIKLSQLESLLTKPKIEIK